LRKISLRQVSVSGGTMKRRASIIPPDVAAQVQFLSNRTCCVCRRQGKPVQLHHIDSDPANNDIENLAVLCLDCHMQTLISGGFYRKLDASQVRLYRDDWLNIVSRQRTRKPPVRLALAEPPKPAPMYWSNRPGAAATHREKPVRLAKPLEVVNVNIIDDPDAVISFKKEWLPEGDGPPRKKGVFPILEVKLRNSTKEAIPLKRLEIEVKAVRITYDPVTYHTPPVSWEYNVLLNPHEAGARKSVKLSQGIEAGQSGRFIIIIGQLSGYGELKYADYELHLSLFYNTEQSLDLGTHRARVHSPPFFLLSKERTVRQLKS
jgi:hypothetical protein